MAAPSNSGATDERRLTRKRIIAMEERGGTWAHNAPGDVLAACCLQTEEETLEEIMAWGYPLLVRRYPGAQLEAGPGIEPQDLPEVFLGE